MARLHPSSLSRRARFASLRPTTLVVALGLLAQVARPARADVRIDGSYRMRFALDDDLLLDDQGSQLGQKRWAEHRLRLTPKLTGENAEIQASFDLVSGLFAGQLAPGFSGLGYVERSERNGTRARGFDFRHLFMSLRTPTLTLDVGQMPAHWGMGMLINSGNEDRAPDFGDVRFGDIVDRVQVTFSPFRSLGPRSALARRVHLSLAADLIYRDRWANLVTRTGTGIHFGDTAGQLVAALGVQPSDSSFAGLYVSRRIQSYEGNQGSLHQWTFDATARTAVPLGDLAVLMLQAEAADIVGGTSHAPRPGQGPVTLSEQGAAARATLASSFLEGELEGGYASGTGAPLGNEQHDFSMSRDFKVGLILFDEVRLFQSQNAARRLADPTFQARAPAGLDLIPTQGAVSNALYLKPTVRAKPFGGALRLTGSLLWAVAPQPLVDPYQSLLASAPLGPYGMPAGRAYGLELDGGASWARTIGGALGLEFEVQAGRFFPGNAFALPNGGNLGALSAARLRAGLYF